MFDNMTALYSSQLECHFGFMRVEMSVWRIPINVYS